MDDDWRDCGHYQDDMANNCNCKSIADCFVTSKIRVSYICAQERCQVNPELVKCSESGGSLLALVQRSRLSSKASSRVTSLWKRLLDKVGNYAC